MLPCKLAKSNLQSPIRLKYVELAEAKSEALVYKFIIYFKQQTCNHCKVQRNPLGVEPAIS